MKKTLDRGGFTLAEMLVAMALLAVLAAVVLPSVLNQMNKGEISRASNDLKNIGEATKTFYTDVQRWPASLAQLGAKPASSATALDGSTYPTALLDRWKGPYLDRGADLTGGIKTGFGGTISNTFESRNWADAASGTAAAGDAFLVVSVTGLGTEDIRRVNDAIDGIEAGTSGTGWQTQGLVRQTGSGTVTLKYYASPISLP